MKTTSRSILAKRITPAALALLGITATASAQIATGEFSAAFLGVGNIDTAVGLTSLKEYRVAANLGSAANVTVNGVTFTGNANVNPTLAGFYTPTTGLGNPFGSGGPNPGGQLGLLMQDFVYGNAGTAEVMTFPNLTIGDTYVLSYFNSSWEAASAVVRNQTMSASGASTSAAGLFTFDEDMGATAAGQFNVLRYTFTAASASQVISFLNQNAGTMHQYAFALERVFNNTYVSGANWTTATWGAAGTPNGQGRSAAFAAAGAPTAVSLDAPVTLGHLQFDGGTNAYTISGAGANTLTLQADVGGVSTLVSKTAGANHTINSDISLQNKLLKTGAGKVVINGNINAVASANLHVAGGTLTINGNSTHRGETILNSNAVLEVTTLGDYGVASGIGARQLADENGTVTGVGLHFEGGTLRFIGSTPQSTNRNLRFITGTAGGIEASGTTPSATMSFTNSGTPLNLFDTGGTRTINLGGTNTGANTFAIQVINQGASQTSVQKLGVGTWFLTNNANTYTGETIIGGGGGAAGAGILNVSSLSNFGVPSAIGARTVGEENATGNGVSLHFRSGTLQYTGSTPQSTDRQIRMLNDVGGVSGATIDASGSNPAATLSFTRSAANTNLYDTGGARTITLTGSNTGANLFALPLTDQVAVTGATGINKRGTGTWNITNAASTFGGVITMEGGILNVGSLSNYGVASSIGARTFAQDVATNIGLLFRGGTLQYTGATAQSTDRAIRVSTVGGATIDASGSNAGATLSFTRASSPDFFENGGNRQLTLTGTNTGANTFGMAIVETGGQTTLTKNGPGKWVLTGASTHTGATNVNNGTLLLNGMFGNTAVSVASGATFGGSGTSTGSVAVAAGARLTPGASVGTLTVGALTLGAGSQLDYEFSGTNDLVNVTGAGGLTLNGGGFNLFVENTATPFATNGTYTLLDYNTGFGGSISNLNILNSQTGKFYTIADNIGSTTIELTIANAVETEWNGVAADGLWTSAGNWTGGTPNAQGVVAKFGSLVVGPTAVSVDGPKTAGAIVFDNANAYNVSGGAGDIITLDNGAGAAAIGIVNGSHVLAAPLALAGNLNVTGATNTFLTLGGNITGATRNLAFAGTGASTLTLTGSNSYDSTIISSGILALGGAGGTLGNGGAAIAPGAILALNRTGSFTLSNNISGGGTLSQISGGTATLGGTNSFAALSILTGTVQAGGASAIPSNVAVTTDGTLDLNTFDASASALTGSGIVTDNSLVAGTTTLTLNLGGTSTYTGSLTSGANRSLAVQINSGTLAHSGNLGVASIGLGAAGTLSLDRNDDYTVAIPITGAGTLAKTGAGIITLSGVNNFATLNVSNGILKAGSATALNTTGTATISNATLDMDDFSGTVGGLAGTNGTVTSNGSTPGTSTVSVSGAASTTFDGTISDGPERFIALSKTGNGILTLAGSTTNSFYGGTTITGGTLRLQKTAGNAIVSDITIGDANGSDFLELGASDQIGDASVVTFTAGGLGNSAFFRLNGFNETVRGITTTVGNAAVLENNSATVGNVSILTVDTAGGDFAYDGIIRNTSVAASIFGLTKAGAGTLTLRNTAAVNVNGYTGATTISDGKLVLDNLSGMAATTITINSATPGALTIDQTTRDMSTALVLAGSGEFVKNGTFTTTLTGPSSFAGKSIVNDGTLGLGNNGVLGTSEIVMNGGIIRAVSAGRILNNPVTVNGSFTLGRLTDLIGPITLNADATITANNFDGPANNPSNLGPIGGAFRIGFAEGPQGIGTGSLNITAVNTNTGGTLVTSGRLNVTATGALSTDDLTVNGGALNFNNAAQTISNLDGAGGTITLSSTALTLNHSADTTFAGVIAGTGSINFTQDGELILSGANTFSGTTTIADGGIIVSGGLNSSAITITGGTLGGSGSTGSVTSTGGTVAPGESAGTLTLASLNLDGASTLSYELSTPGIFGSGVNDLLAIGGDLTLDGTLEITELSGFANGLYRLATYGGAFTDSGLDLPTTFTITYPGSYVDTSIAGIVDLVVVPEPGTAVLLLGGLALLARRRRTASTL